MYHSKIYASSLDIHEQCMGLGRSFAAYSSSSEDSDDEVIQQLKRERVRQQRWQKREEALNALVIVEKKERHDSTSSEDSLLAELRSEMNNLNKRMDAGTGNLFTLRTDLSTEANAFESSINKLSKMESKIGPYTKNKSIETEKILELYDSTTDGEMCMTNDEISCASDEEIVYEYVTASSSEDDMPSLQEQLKLERSSLKTPQVQRRALGTRDSGVGDSPPPKPEPTKNKISNNFSSAATKRKDDTPPPAPKKKPKAHTKNPSLQQFFIPTGVPEKIKIKKKSTTEPPALDQPKPKTGLLSKFPGLKKARDEPSKKVADPEIAKLFPTIALNKKRTMIPPAAKVNHDLPPLVENKILPPVAEIASIQEEKCIDDADEMKKFWKSRGISAPKNKTKKNAAVSVFTKGISSLVDKMKKKKVADIPEEDPDNLDWLEAFKSSSEPKETKSDHTKITLAIKAFNLPNKLSFGTSDPYYEFKFDGKVLYSSECLIDKLDCAWKPWTFEIPNKCLMRKIQIRIGCSECDDVDDLLAAFEMTFPFRHSIFIADEAEDSVRIEIEQCDFHTKLDLAVTTDAKLTKGNLQFEIINRLNQEILHTSKEIWGGGKTSWQNQEFTVPGYACVHGLDVRFFDAIDSRMTMQKNGVQFGKKQVGCIDIKFPFVKKRFSIRSRVCAATMHILSDMSDIDPDEYRLENDIHFRVLKVIQSADIGIYHMPNTTGSDMKRFLADERLWDNFGKLAGQ